MGNPADTEMPIVDTRSVDDLGRVVIPRVLRKQFGIEEGDEVAFIEGVGGVLIRKAKPCCAICRSLEDLTFINGGKTAVCRRCVCEIAHLHRERDAV